ncbi:MAG: undecaprenyl-phosphate galactose phosphotransferase WbaP [Burkholderiales bacterium]
MFNRRLIPITLLAASFLIIAAIGQNLRHKGNFAHVRIQAGNDLTLTFLRQHIRGHEDCESAAESFAELMIANCPICRITRQECLHELSTEQSNLFSDAPVPYTTARLQNGVMIYQAADPQAALATCRLSEEHAPSGLVICSRPDSPRPLPAKLQNRYDSQNDAFHDIAWLAGALILSLTLYLARQLHNRRAAAASVHLPYNAWPAKITLATGDTLVMLGTFLAIAWPNGPAVGGLTTIERNTLLIHAGLIGVTILWFWVLLEHYSRRRPFWDELRELVRVLATMFMIAVSTIFIAGVESAPSVQLSLWFFNLLLIPLARTTSRGVLDCLGLWQMRTVIIGAGENARDAAAALAGENSMGYHVMAFIDLDAAPLSAIANEFNQSMPPVIACPGSHTASMRQQLEQLLAEQGQPQIVVALDSLSTAENQQLVQRLSASARNIHIIPAIRGLPLFGTQASHFFSHEVLFLTVRNNLARRSYQWIKRTFDIIGASALLVILSPLMAYVAWRIWREDGRPVIFHQRRLAKGSGEFDFLKFRSMVKDADELLARWRETNSAEWQEYYANNFKLKNDPRVLGVGSWIRTSSLDELPQLINVLRGEMSLVGPRPLLARELPEYGGSIHYYRQARPGISGLWQISGRSQTQFNDRALLDEWYVQNWSLWYDIAILFKTINVVLGRDGAH